MRAAVLHEYGVPRADQFSEPVAGAGQAVVDVLAAGVNPVDVAISAGRFYAGRPQLPCVAGREGVAVLAGRRVYFDTPVAPFGSIAERTLVQPEQTHPLPDGLDDGLAVAFGIAGLAAWLALSWRARVEAGEHVLVLGASGVVGQIAVQCAKLLGAGRVVAAARSQSALARSAQLGADACVALGAEDLPAALADASEGRIDVVVDPLFGEPFTAAVQAASHRARLVQLGAAADSKATLPSAAIRGKMLVIMGHSNFAAPLDVRRDAYLRMADAGLRGELTVEVERRPLEMVGEAWARLAASSHRKIVLTP